MSKEVIENTTKTKKKQQKAEDFIGWKSPDGKLEVIGIIKKSKHTIFKVTCTECSKYPELFPDGYFVSYKNNLKNGYKPCGCSKKVFWTEDQYIIKAKEVAEKLNIVVIGFKCGFEGHDSKIRCYCPKHDFYWELFYGKLVNGRGCPKCSNRYRPTEQEALERCTIICKDMGYNPIGFIDGYKGAHNTTFEYVCPKHGLQKIRYHGFVNTGSRCPSCWKEYKRAISNLKGYYPERKDEQDFLYVLNFNNQFIKVGRSFDVDERMKGLRTASKIPIKKIHKIHIFKATHREIYNYEQELLEELRDRGFQHTLDWTTECFDNDCYFILNKLLKYCDFEEVNLDNN